MLERQIRSYMSERGSVFRALVFDSVDSTNTVLAGLAREGAEEYTAVIAGAQTAGRGRGEHRFFSPAGCGVYFSLLLRPRIPAEAAAKLVTPACAVAAAEAIENVSGETAGIKWVNDIQIEGKKVCGILTEAAVGLETGALDYMVLGAGVNLYPPVKGFPEEIQPIAGSVLERSCPEAKNRLVGEFLNRFWDFYTHPECRTYLEDYRSRSLAIGQNVTVLSAGRAVSAYAYGIDDDFRLLVRYENGDTEALSYGEIRIQLAESAP